jgi:hypothetical protein
MMYRAIHMNGTTAGKRCFPSRRRFVIFKHLRRRMARIPLARLGMNRREPREHSYYDSTKNLCELYQW